MCSAPPPTRPPNVSIPILKTLVEVSLNVPVTMNFCVAPASIVEFFGVTSMESRVTPIPDTVTGVEESVVVPSPSWPKVLFPQHCTVASARSAQLWSVPARAVAVVSPVTGTGVKESVVVPFPNWPK